MDQEALQKRYLMSQKFIIDNIEVDYERETNNNTVIQSSPSNYNLIFETQSFSTVLEDMYEEGDIILIDKNVLELYPVGNKASYVVEAIEENKNIKTVLKFVEFLNSVSFNKKNKVIVIGGGITQDIGAFASCIFKRGVRWVLFPTTLLSMCDSCIGGKTGINHLNGKNQLGLFSKPESVHICFNFLGTLEDVDLKSGLGEILKLYSLADREYILFYDSVVSNGRVTDKKDYPELVKRALLIKKAVIEVDEYEHNIRKCLNYGHTLGHAVEILSNYKISHGIAVAIGIVLVNKLFGFSGDLYNQMCLDLVDIELLKSVDLNGIMELVKKDKKTIGNKTTFAVLRQFGIMTFDPTIVDENLMNKVKNIIGNL